MSKKIFIVTENMDELKLIREVVKQLDQDTDVKFVFGLKELAALVKHGFPEVPDLLLLNVGQPAYRAVPLLAGLQHDEQYPHVQKFVVTFRAYPFHQPLHNRGRFHSADLLPRTSKA